MKIKVSENEIMNKIESINLKEVKDASSYMNNYTNFLSLKLRKNRGGIIYTVERIKNLEAITKKLNKELSENNKELKKLEKSITNFSRINEDLENNIITEINRNKAYKSRLFQLKKNKIKLRKTQENVDKDIIYMESRINMMRENVEQNNNKYNKLLNTKNKMHDEMEKFKKGRTNLQLQLKNTRKNHEILKNKMQTFVSSIKTSNARENNI
ncbi:hypothetical protein YYC_03209 [Plasmodium yoelii 17X]|uniref:Uncharacterized protein n=4 Tax=Plasmodium yoelii TaxID=5861 RepID=A0AAE9WRP7_PLAYO|nr:conserved Plasmodium protein, unknown function [Plasmodium yoelii]EAA21745.1 hypothetical protein [Plasmodium yoelii yoelii]ETB59830.1 hypothetical protein YYC_03209 [Plasmodium yoelii 17X]WBY57831.1 hypothetical protein Py17XNL_001002148 [Plasmodium yoelii yoelii]CDU84933.1 conserved Plasmodium protein, unknown function [Plasmodium yoelii]VTZ78829.1 conserved Plasmodium protein, unknown function [Plasmodium yoelii]|eukprot:XP_730180.1 conserved Plasmodium protein, unknown function [Plasmodium yoelii]